MLHNKLCRLVSPVVVTEDLDRPDEVSEWISAMGKHPQAARHQRASEHLDLLAKWYQKEICVLAYSRTLTEVFKCLQIGLGKRNRLAVAGVSERGRDGGGFFPFLCSVSNLDANCKRRSNGWPSLSARVRITESRGVMVVIFSANSSPLYQRWRWKPGIAGAVLAVVWSCADVVYCGAGPAMLAPLTTSGT